MMRRTVVAVLAAAWLAWVSAGAEAAGLDPFLGNWVRAERDHDDAARDATIVRATEPMSFAFRDVARGVMRRRMVPVERYVVESGAPPVIRNDKGMVFPLDGRAHPTGEDRECANRLTEAGEIEQSWKEGSDSHGTTIWRIDGEGHLIVTQRVIDPHFEAPLEYSTTYQRE
jgi:hypothetical protein